jgi:murein DD-endopeptidase MepM/ murein hydrolase activator NlpD
MTQSIVVEFPLRGEWMAPHTPGSRVPSHGTDLLGQRYAFDLVRPGPDGKRFFRGSAARYLLLGMRLRDCFGWGEPIYATADGTVVEASDGWPERDPLHPVRDLAVVLKNGLTFDPEKTDLRRLVGNHVIVETADGFAVFAHAQRGSLKVRVGDHVTTGQQLANVGHSGNSTAPHLHFQMMDGPDARTAAGLEVRFREYEVLRDGEWETVCDGLPKSDERIRRL